MSSAGPSAFVADLDSGYAMTHAMLGLTYAYKSMPERAVAELVLARKAGGDRPDLIALHGYALARAGHTGEALATIDELIGSRSREILPLSGWPSST
jgi:hypothetical protein